MSLWRLIATTGAALRTPGGAKRCLLDGLDDVRRGLLTKGLHTSMARRSWPPALFALFKPISRTLVLLLGRRYRLWWRQLPTEKKNDYLVKYRRLGIAVTVSSLCFVLGLVVAHVQECPVTGRRRFVALTPQQAVKIGHKEHDMLMETYDGVLLPSDDQEYERVSRVAARILKANVDLEGVKDKTWSVNVVNQPDRNAFVLPSGSIFVFRGMLNLCSNDDQLGIIISHEIAHTVLNHIAEKLSYLGLINLLVLLPLATLWLLFPNDGIALVADWFVRKFVDVVVELPFSRDLEAEADHVGLLLAAKACFDVREAPNFWRTMNRLQKNVDPPQLLSTHPANETREKSLITLLPNALALRLQCGCNPLTTKDPNVLPDPRLIMAEERVAKRLQAL